MNILYIIGLMVCAEVAPQAVIKKGQYKLLLISFDGFRYDYIDKYQPSNFLKFASQGVHIKKGMKPSFPSKTFPNHYTLATGLYPESHGIVDNTMYDSLWNATFFQNTSESRWFEDGEPIWITAKLQGLKTGVYFWVGSEATIKGVKANYWLPYNKKVPFETRVDEAIRWLAHENVTFAAIYFHEPDSAGHKNGTMSEGTRIQVDKMNTLLGYILDSLKTKQLQKDTNVILVSDHGMANVSQVDDNRNLVIDKHLDPGDYVAVVQSGPVAAILPRERKATKVRDQLKGKSLNVDVYLKKDIPEEFHYRNNRRIMPVIAIAKEPFQVVRTAEELKWSVGNHGYNNSNPSMHALFMASGPSFQKGMVVDTFENVNVYPLMCHLLGVEPSRNNGSFENVKHMLTTENNNNANLLTSTMPVITITLLVTFSGLFSKNL